MAVVSVLLEYKKRKALLAYFRTLPRGKLSCHSIKIAKCIINYKQRETNGR